MSRLPLHIVDLIRQKQLPRITLQGGLEENEKNLDKLVINHRDILGELLIENEFLDDAMSLKFLAQQFLKTDVLFAAVDEDDNPERLVIVENKLLKNPASKRTVIGQILDYAGKFVSVNAKQLRDFTEEKLWIDENEDALNRCFKEEKFLLAICGDEIHASVADIIGRFARWTDRHPTTGMQLCLVAMQLYGDETDRILIPYVVGRVTEAERQIQIIVTNPAGEPVPATIKVVEGASVASSPIKPNQTQDEWFTKKWTKFGPKAITDTKQFLADLAEADITGLTITLSGFGKPRVRLSYPTLGRQLNVLFVRTNYAAIRDAMTEPVWQRPELKTVGENFREALLRIPGSTKTAKGQAVIPAESLVAGKSAVIQAFEELAESLNA